MMMCELQPMFSTLSKIYQDKTEEKNLHSTTSEFLPYYHKYHKHYLLHIPDLI